MKKRRVIKNVLFGAMAGVLAYIVSLAAQFLKAGQLQAAGWSICPSYISGMFNLGLLQAGVIATISSLFLLFGLPCLIRKRKDVETRA